MQLKKVKDLIVGDIVINDSDGVQLEIKSIQSGMYVSPSKLLQFTTGEYSNYYDNDEVEYAGHVNLK